MMCDLICRDYLRSRNSTHQYRLHVNQLEVTKNYNRIIIDLR